MSSTIHYVICFVFHRVWQQAKFEIINFFNADWKLVGNFPKMGKYDRSRMPASSRKLSDKGNSNLSGKTQLTKRGAELESVAKSPLKDCQQKTRRIDKNKEKDVLKGGQNKLEMSKSGKNAREPGLRAKTNSQLPMSAVGKSLKTKAVTINRPRGQQSAK